MKLRFQTPALAALADHSRGVPCRLLNQPYLSHLCSKSPIYPKQTTTQPPSLRLFLAPTAISQATLTTPKIDGISIDATPWAASFKRLYRMRPVLSLHKPSLWAHPIQH